LISTFFHARPNTTVHKAASSAPASTATKKVTTDATCGGTNQFTCQGSIFGNCCSAAGYCGSTTDYCGTGCQSGFGTCGTSSQAPAPSASAAPGKVSEDGSCGGASGQTCQGSSFGNCCSQYGFCGSTADFCNAACQPAFGTCPGSGPASSAVASSPVSSKAPAASTPVVKPTPTPTPVAPQPPKTPVSQNGFCGGSQGTTCTGSRFGRCCGPWGTVSCSKNLAYTHVLTRYSAATPSCLAALAVTRPSASATFKISFFQVDCTYFWRQDVRKTNVGARFHNDMEKVFDQANIYPL